jgi:ceramide glucosyltransferase
LQLLAGIAGAGASLGILYLAVAWFAVLRFRREQVAVGPERPGVTILKPVCGLDPELYDNLLSYCRQDYRGPVQLVIGAHRENDPAVAITRKLMADLPEADIHLVIDGGLIGTNLKISNVANAFKVARHDVLIIADSDMRVGPRYLDSVVGALMAPGVGMVTTLYRARAVGGLASRLGAGFINYSFLPSVLVGRLLNAAAFTSGSTMALRRATLKAIGGLPALANQLADDYVLGALVRGQGLEVVLSTEIVENVVEEPGLVELYRHELRWQRTIRTIAPLGHAATVITNPVALAAFAILASGSSPSAWLLLMAGLAMRLGLVYTCDRVYGLEPMGFGLLPLRDALSFVGLVASFMGQRVTWRDSSFQVGRRGELTVEGDSSV